MAVYKRRVQPYAGSLQDRWRFAVISRYGLERVFRSRLIWIYFVLSFIPPFIAGAMIYIRNSPDLFPAARPAIDGFITVDAQFFAVLMGVQSTLAFFMAALTGPGLVSPDLVHGALPLYLSRPLSRAGYAFGKFLVLAALLSAVTWIPGILLFLLQSALAGGGWLADNGHIAVAIAAGAWTWILTISLLALAISAWVRWRAVAGAVLFGVFFVGTGFGELANELLRTDWGAMLSLSGVITAIWQSLFLDMVFEIDYPLPIWTAWLTVIVVWSASLGLLALRLRGSEAAR